MSSLSQATHRRCPPTVVVYPAIGVTVKAVAEPWFTVCCALGPMVPSGPADGVTVQVWMFAEQLSFVPPYEPLQVRCQPVSVVVTTGVVAV